MNPDNAKADIIGLDNNSKTPTGSSGSADVVVAALPLVLAVGELLFSLVRLLCRV
jgi:hypothetical protein